MIPIYPADAPKTGAAAQSTQSVKDQFLQPGSLHLTSLPPLSLYIHFPWCVRKCPYCDFNSHQVEGDNQAGFPEQAYLTALRHDLELALPQIWGRKIYTIFIGGGTPSLLSMQGMDQLMSDLRSLLPLDGAAEITMEANPGTFEVEKFKAFRASGINRLSIGIQSFNDAHLKALGRIHDGSQARFAVAQAREHFENLNLDLMYALPGQSLAQAESDLQIAIDLAPTHLSLYHLTLEPNTVFAKYPPVLPDDDLSAQMQDSLVSRAQAAGFLQYEVSAYARAGHKARHNLNYWQFGDYLGIGAGAHSKLSFPHRIVRQERYKQPKSYMEQCQRGTPISEEHEIRRDELGFEFMLNTLRLVDGFPVSLFAERTGTNMVSIQRALEQAEQRGLLWRDHQSVRPTELGQRFLNDLQQLFLPD